MVRGGRQNQHWNYVFHFTFFFPAFFSDAIHKKIDEKLCFGFVLRTVVVVVVIVFGRIFFPVDSSKLIFRLVRTTFCFRLLCRCFTTRRRYIIVFHFGIFGHRDGDSIVIHSFLFSFFKCFSVFVSISVPPQNVASSIRIRRCE